MPVTVWKGHLTFGLVSIPIRLFRAARREKISFHQLYRSAPAESAAETEHPVEADEPEEAEPPEEAAASAPVSRILQGAFTREDRTPIPASQIVKGYEYEKNRYVTIEKGEIEKITPKTSTDMEIFEFVKFAEIDPIYLDASYYVAPEEAGEKPYALLFDTMRESGYVALAEFAMRRRQRPVVIRPSQSGVIAHTMFYADEIRKADEYRADTSLIAKKEKDLALTLIRSMAAKFEPEKLKDTYREKLRELIAAKVAGRQIAPEAPAKAPPVVDIVEALERSLAIKRKPVASTRGARGIQNGRGIKKKNQR